MPIYVHNGTDWQVASQPGGLRPYVHNGTAWQPVTEVYVHNGTDWQLSYQYDATAPTASTPTASRVSTGSTMTVNYGTITDSESGITSVKLYRRYLYNGSYDSTNGTLRTTIYSGAATASVSAGSYADSISTAIRKNPTDNKDYTVYYRLEMTDAAGNVGYTPWSTGVPTKPYGTFAVNPTASKVWSVDNSAWVSTSLVISGYWDASLGYQNGYLFYGAQFPNTCVGYSPDDIQMFFFRNGSYGYSGNNYYCAHAHQSQPTTPTAMTAYMDAGPNLTGSGASAWFTVPSGWYDEIAAGTILGFATRGGQAYKNTSTNYYRQLVAITSYTGACQFTFT
jgi:hypothetical protein